jgi:hypothetical protein
MAQGAWRLRVQIFFDMCFISQAGFIIFILNFSDTLCFISRRHYSILAKAIQVPRRFRGVFDAHGCYYEPGFVCIIRLQFCIIAITIIFTSNVPDKFWLDCEEI